MIGEIHFSFATFLFLGSSKIRFLYPGSGSGSHQIWRIRIWNAEQELINHLSFFVKPELVTPVTTHLPTAPNSCINSTFLLTKSSFSILVRSLETKANSRAAVTPESLGTYHLVLASYTHFQGPHFSLGTFPQSWRNLDLDWFLAVMWFRIFFAALEPEPRERVKE